MICGTIKLPSRFSGALAVAASRGREGRTVSSRKTFCRGSEWEVGGDALGVQFLQAGELAQNAVQIGGQPRFFVVRQFQAGEKGDAGNFVKCQLFSHVVCFDKPRANFLRFSRGTGAKKPERANPGSGRCFPSKSVRSAAWNATCASWPADALPEISNRSSFPARSGNQ